MFKRVMCTNGHIFLSDNKGRYFYTKLWFDWRIQSPCDISIQISKNISKSFKNSTSVLACYKMVSSKKHEISQENISIIPIKPVDWTIFFLTIIRL